ncbi:MAG: YfbR-like 5'-deoxynucleotidase, partial [Oscillospiraceae bacterium]
MKLYSFNALVSRMKYITRWGLMRSSRTETLCEHTADTAIVAHTLAAVAKNVFGMEVSPEKIAVAALYHDAPEILTGDMPT